MGDNESIDIYAYVPLVLILCYQYQQFQLHSQSLFLSLTITGMAKVSDLLLDSSKHQTILNSDLKNGNKKIVKKSVKSEKYELKSLLKPNGDNNCNQALKSTNIEVLSDCVESPKSSRKGVTSATKTALNNTVSWEDEHSKNNGITHVKDHTHQPKAHVSNEDLCHLEPKQDNDHNVMEVLRVVVRTCTNPDTSKRPSASEINELLKSYL